MVHEGIVEKKEFIFIYDFDFEKVFEILKDWSFGHSRNFLKMKKYKGSVDWFS